MPRFNGILIFFTSQADFRWLGEICLDELQTQAMSKRKITYFLTNFSLSTLNI
jgi:hypothetical protein